MNDKEVKKEKEDLKTSIRNFLVTFVIAIIVVTFIFTGGPLLGINDFIKDLGKTKIKNEDGTISIPQEAQVAQNRDNPNSYVGRIMNQKIQLGRQDEFNIRLSSIMSSQQINPYQKYQYARMIFDNTINKIIGMKNAHKMNITISKNWLNKEVGKRYFSDSEGDINYEAMKKERGKVNKYAKEIQEDLLYDSFVQDYFKGLPVTQEEALENYKLENVKVTLKYINLSTQEVDEKLLAKFYDENKDSYKQYKLTRLVFKDKTEAEKALKEVTKDKAKFIEIGNKLKIEDKIVNIVYDSEYSFIDDFENADLKNAVRTTQNKEVAKTVVQTSVGPIVFYIEDVRYPELADDKLKQKLKSEYIARNFKAIEDENKKKADELYALAKKDGLEKAANKFNLKVETSGASSFLGYGMPNVNPDLTDDKNYIAKAFKSKKNDILEPFKHSNGYMIAMVSDKADVDLKSFEDMYDDLSKKYSNGKSMDIEGDYYTKERKKYEIVDNFSYVFKIQDFIQKQE
ncbi:MAG: hypothetical protein A2086_09395 [Spirochaetes bacterium GWD1_27_9]|nr:MAG: hypothetical protein A2Z98_15280 [Spirochaetes bacterium GWB1_27_13]OHD27115.1 MAG: hypothetical protein A2Y34_11100 [Spirochaetes bacterium GWC1_27_15]OHD28788.1 MAG: hypothetical protein A2086_09395 [Spirochaetes bacterium GWD1_27_9]